MDSMEQFEFEEETKQWHLDDGTAQYTIRLIANQLFVDGADLSDELFPEIDHDSTKNEKPQRDVLNNAKKDTKFENGVPLNYVNSREVMLEIINELEAEVMSGHLNRSNFKCDECSKYFKSKLILGHHKIKFHKKNVNKVLLQKMKIEEELNNKEDETDFKKSEKQLKGRNGDSLSNKNFYCGICRRLFARKHWLIRHLKSGKCKQKQEQKEGRKRRKEPSVLENSE